MGEPRRRDVLAAGAAGLMAVTLAGCGDDQPKPPRADTPDPDPFAAVPAAVGMSDPGPTPPATAKATIMHVVAHPDDDLFFLNPDLQQSIAAGHRIVGVCVTAAESSGRNGPHARHADAASYVKARQNALRAAYGQMVSGDPAARWSRSTLGLPYGARAEADTLGNVTLIFLNIRKTFWDGRLRNLWVGRIGSLPTLVPTGSAVTRSYRYGRTELIDALVHLLNTFRPTLVRTMDPDPDLQLHNRRHPRKTDHGDLSDHEDHTATAQFTWAALERYAGRGRHWTVESYRGYYNCRWPYNLSEPAWQSKRALLDIYSGDTAIACTDRAGCADLAMKGRIVSSGWGQSTHERYVSTTPWLIRKRDGALAAFGVVDRQAAVWNETAPGSGVWSGPTLLGGATLVPRLSVSLLPDGRWLLLGLRIAELGPDERDHRRTVMALEEGGIWRDLGTSEAGPVQRQLGMPVAAGDRLFVRRASKTPVTRRRAADGSWGGWQDMGGPQVQEGMYALARGDGRTELYGLGRLSIVRWYQERRNGPFLVDRNLKLPTPGTPPYVLESPDGGLLLIYRLAGNGQATAFRMPPKATTFDPTPIPLGGQGGIGPMQALPTPSGQLLLVQRNDAGTTSTAHLPAAAFTPAIAVSWNTSGPWLVRPPGAAIDAKGRVVLAGLTPDAHLQSWTVL